MKYCLIFLSLILITSGCTIPTPAPSYTEMVMSDEPVEWMYTDSEIAWLIMNEQVDY